MAQPVPPSPASADLLFERGPGAHCPDEAALREAIAARIGRDPFVAADDAGPAPGPSRGRPLVHVTLERVGPRVLAHVAMQSAAGTVVSRRELSEQAARCDELVLALAVSLGITFDVSPDDAAIDEPAALGSGTPAGSVVMMSLQNLEAPVASQGDAAGGAPRPPPAEVRTRTVAPASSPAPAQPRLRVLASGAVQLGAQPEPAAALLAGAGVRFGWISVLADLRFASGVRVESTDGATASTTWAGAALAPCAHVDRWGVCVVAEIARLSGRGSGVAAPREASLWLASAGLSGLGEWWITRSLALHARAELTLPATSVELRLDDRTLWRTPAWKLMAGLGVTVETR